MLESNIENESSYDLALDRVYFWIAEIFLGFKGKRLGILQGIMTFFVSIDNQNEKV